MVMLNRVYKIVMVSRKKLSWKVGARSPNLPLVTITLWSCFIGSIKLSWFLGITCHVNNYEHTHQDPVFNYSEKSRCWLVVAATTNWKKERFCVNSATYWCIFTCLLSNMTSLASINVRCFLKLFKKHNPFFKLEMRYLRVKCIN